MFHFHVLRGIDTVDKFQMLEKMFPGLTGRSREAIKVLFDLVAKLDRYAAGQKNRSAADEKSEQIGKLTKIYQSILITLLCRC